MVRIENNSHMLDVTLKVMFLTFCNAFFALTYLKPLKLGLFAMKLGTQHYLVCIIVLNWLELKTIIIYLILRAKLRFQGY